MLHAFMKFVVVTVCSARISDYWKPRSDPLDVPQQPLKPQGYLPTGENCTVTLNHSGPKSQCQPQIKQMPNSAFIPKTAPMSIDGTIKGQPNVAPSGPKEVKELPKPVAPKVIPETDLKKERKLIGLVAYGIYRPLSYYRLIERHFRKVNGYDDYLVKIFQDDDYVILTKFVLLPDLKDDFVLSYPPNSNVLIVNRKHFEGGEDFVQMLSLKKLRARWEEKEKVAYFLSQLQTFRDYPLKHFKNQ